MYLKCIIKITEPQKSASFYRKSANTLRISLKNWAMLLKKKHKWVVKQKCAIKIKLASSTINCQNIQLHSVTILCQQ